MSNNINDDSYGGMLSHSHSKKKKEVITTVLTMMKPAGN